MKREKIQATVTFTPLTKEQKEYGLKGALEALELVLNSDLNRETVARLKTTVEKQLEDLTDV